MLINGDENANVLTGAAEADEINGFGGDDTITGNGGNDLVDAGLGDDTFNVNATVVGGSSVDGADAVDLMRGDDVVNVTSDGSISEVRLRFTSNEVGNDDALQSGTQANQDSGLAVLFQAEDGANNTIGQISRYDDEGITFDGGNLIRFDVRDLVSGTQRGNFFDAVTLGAGGNDVISPGVVGLTRNYYVNGGMGLDTITTGGGDDFLVGGAGNDRLIAGDGDDSLLGGGGADTASGGAGNDTYILNASTDGADSVNLGVGNDLVNVTAAAGVTNVRLTFTSAEVGNARSLDGGVAGDNQDGGYAVRLAVESAGGVPSTTVGRFDDEGVTFATAPGGALRFDVRDLVSGVGRGEAFEVVTLGTSGADVVDQSASARSYYINGGLNADTLTGGSVDDFLVGGAGNDVLIGGAGNDSFIGGAGTDRINGGAGDDLMIVNASTEGADSVALGIGLDTVRVSAAAGVTNVRLTFTSAEVGNGTSYDGGVVGNNQDGGFAVRFAVEAGGTPSSTVSRFDDEGISFESAPESTVRFDVRDLVSGAQRGETFQVVTLATNRADTIDETGETRSYYINGGQGADTITGGSVDDFLVGGAGNDTLDGSAGADRYIGGGGADVFSITSDGLVDTFIYAALTDSTTSAAGRDFIVGFVQGEDKINLAAIDANNTNAVGTNDTFTFSATGAFTGAPGAPSPGELIAFDGGGFVIVQGDVNGDGAADFEIYVDSGALATLDANDFVL